MRLYFSHWLNLVIRKEGPKLNVNKLKGAIIASGYTVPKLAAKTGIKKGVLYRRLRDGGESFTIKEMLAIEKVLNISQAELHNIFFE